MIPTERKTDPPTREYSYFAHARELLDARDARTSAHATRKGTP